MHPLYPLSWKRSPGRRTSSRARQTGAGEHRLGATLAAGGAATAAVVGEVGDRATADKRRTGAGGRASHLRLLALLCAIYPHPATSAGPASLARLPHPPLTTFLGRWLCFVEPRRWRALLICPSGPLSHTIPTSGSDSPCHMHARCLPPASLNDYHQFAEVSSTRVRRHFASSATFTVTLPSSRATISENQISCSLTV